MAERRKDAITRQDLRNEIHKELLQFNSPKKNGEPWSEYRAKLVTIPNIGILITMVCSIVVFIFSLGGRAVSLESDTAKALEAAKAATAANARLMEELAATRKVMDLQAVALKQQEAMHATKADVAAVRAAISLAITRGEFQRFHREQILPRLDRIENQGRQ